MNATPTKERSSYFLLFRFAFGFIALTCINACSSRLVVSEGESFSSSTAIQDSSLSGFAVQGPIVVSRIEQDGIGVEVRGHEAATLREADLVIRSHAEQLAYEIERLSNPPRVQVTLPDVELASLKKNDSISLNQLALLKEIQLKETRDGVVLDVALSEDQSESASEITYESEPIAGNLYIRFSQTRERNEILPMRNAREDSSLEGLAIVAEAGNPIKTIQDAPSQQVTHAASADASTRGKSAASLPRLKEVRFEHLPAVGQVVVAEVDAPGVFSLSKTAPSEYVLTLEGVVHDSENMRDLVSAPSRTAGIRSVRVVQDGQDTLLRVFANPALQLEAVTRNGSILLQPIDSYLASPSSEIRAQAEVEAELAEAGASDVATNKEVNKEEAGEEDDLSTDIAESTNTEESSDMAGLESEISALLDEVPRYSGRKISLDLQDTEISNALRIIAEVSDLNIIASDDVVGQVTLRLVDVPWDQALDVILKTNALDKVLEGNVMRIAPIGKLRDEREALKQAREAEEGLEPLVVKYIRVSYAKAAELQPLVETVLTERGTVTFDERTNQLIIKDIRRGVKNVAELVARLDLRTPQVLLETQIVEANRTFSRSLGSELGFSMVQSPATGNPTGDNFPNAISIGGSVTPGSDTGSSFPATISSASGSAVSFLLDSADGTRSLDYRLTALEDEGAIRIVSRPSVATTNNQQAIIKSVEKVRVKTPSGGLSVATGSGANASGNGGVATETIEIGIILEVTPQASPDYFVLLDINAKSSTFGAERVDDIPTEIERSATSSVLVSSGQTFAMGGIYKITDSDSVSGVPFLKDIPFFGHLFRRQSVKNADEELIFFITPRIIEGSFDDAAMKGAY